MAPAWGTRGRRVARVDSADDPLRQGRAAHQLDARVVGRAGGPAAAQVDGPAVGRVDGPAAAPVDAPVAAQVGGQVAPADGLATAIADAAHPTTARMETDAWP